MSALAATTPTRGGVVVTGSAVASTDTIAVSLLGAKGAFLKIINGNASSDSMTISDSSVTPTGAAATAIAPSVVNATSKVFLITARQADPATGLVTITHSVTSTVTYELYPLG